MPTTRPAAFAAAALGVFAAACLPVLETPALAGSGSDHPSRFRRGSVLPSRGGVRRASRPAPRRPASPPKLGRSDVREAAAALAASTGAPGEIRAMWVVRDSMTSPARIRNAVALAKKYRFNTLFVQVRGRGDAFYDSRFEPRSEELADQPLDFDPLAVAIDEGHKAGLEVHAWMNTFLVWHKGRRPYSGQHVINQHPEWLVQDKNGNRTLTPRHDCEGAFLDPGLPEVREYTKQVFLDVATRYAVDGIHFDYVRFPSEDWSYSAADVREFRDWARGQVPPDMAAYADARAASGNRLAWYHCFKREWKQWRQEVIMNTVRSISEEAHRIKPNLIVSAAVFPNYAVASLDKGQAWHEWLRQGILDAACPMTYSANTRRVGGEVRDAVANSFGRPIVPGVGAWQMPAASSIAKGSLYRSLGAAGINFFSYNGMTREGRTEAYLSKVGGTLFTTPATPPDWRRPAPTVAAAATPEAAPAAETTTEVPGGE
jgi:uncharacterized lipoprotein YddW (UPF0748 family)